MLTKLEIDSVCLEANIDKRKDSFIIEGKLTGKIDVECIKCLEVFEKKVDEDLKLKVVRPPFSGFDEEYDIIEMDDFSLKDIIKSELELIKNDYHICDKCKKLEFDKEF